MNMTLGTQWERESHLVIYEPGPSKRHVDYCFVRRNQRKMVKGIEVLPSDKCITQQKNIGM